jgi:hypothetical protein
MRQGPDDELGADAAAVIGANRPATIVRNVGTPQERRWHTRMGGDSMNVGLFLAQDKVEVRDEVFCDSLDEPRVVFRVTPVVVHHGVSHWEVILKRRSEWRLLTNIPKLYPRWKYHWSGESKIVYSLTEELSLGGGWANTPGVFEPYKGPNKARPKEPDLSKWVAGWLPDVLSAEDRRKISACLWTAHSVFCREAKYPTSTAESMHKAFDGIAQVLFDAGMLTESRLTEDISALVWDSAIAAGWWNLASELPQSIFPEKVGHYWVWRDESRDWAKLFRAEIASWRAKLLVAPQAESGRAPSQPPQNAEPIAERFEITPAGGGNPPGRKRNSEKAQEEAVPTPGADGDATPPGMASIPLEQDKRARVRQAVVMPILKAKRWKPGKWATKAGVSKNSVYEYLNGKRKLGDLNRDAMAEAIDLKAEDLPE